MNKPPQLNDRQKTILVFFLGFVVVANFLVFLGVSSSSAQREMRSEEAKGSPAAETSPINGP